MKQKPTRWLSVLVLLIALLTLAVPPALAEGPAPEPPGNAVVNFRGVIEEKTTPPQQWKISGVVVQLNAQTVVLEQAGPADVGATVQVVGVRQQDRSVLARTIKVLKPAFEPPRPVQFTAPIRALPSHGLLGEWTVGEETVIVSDSTVILPEGVVPDEGDIAHVVGFRTNDNKVDAKTIQIRKPSQVEVSFTGPIQRFSNAEWLVRNVKVLITAATEIEGTPQVGLIAEVKGFLQPDRSVIATYIRVREPQVEPVTFQGIIVSKTNDGFPSVWGIRPLTTTDLFPSVINVTVTASTAIDESKGPADIGALVQVVAIPVSLSASSAGDSVLVAQRIKVLRPPVNQEITFAGRIDQIHDGYWVVRGIRVLITSATVIEGLPPAVGLMAVVTGTLRTDRVVEATHITVKEALPDIVDFTGWIREKSPIPGVWKIAPDGPLPVIYDVWVTPWTLITGPAEVGAHVHVIALRSVSGHLVALKIDVIRDTAE
jgi:hypothetical protein